MIGYYVHHHGHGHLHRALSVARALDEPVTVLSSLPRPQGEETEWVQLDRDDVSGRRSNATAGGRLHWVPTGDPGLRRRMHQLSRWLDVTQPRLLVVDVSVEITMLARLHGVPVVSVVLPGRRDDPAHRLGLDVAEALVAVWPPSVTVEMLPGLPATVHDRIHAVGALARFPVVTPGVRRPGPPRVVLLEGSGGSAVAGPALDAVIGSVPGWEWTVCGPSGRWTDDPHGFVQDADVVVTHAGQNALAEVAAARRPAVVVPQARPHDEQLVTAGVLSAGDWPAIVLDDLRTDGWAELLDEASGLDGSRWARWCDGGAARRFAAVVAAAGTGMRVA